MSRNVDRGNNVVIEDDGLNSREMVVLAVAASTLVVSIAVAIAIWRIATGIMWAMIVLSVGSASQMVLIGAGIYQRHRLTGRALLTDAQGRADAARLEARARIAAERRRWMGDGS